MSFAWTLSNAPIKKETAFEAGNAVIYKHMAGHDCLQRAKDSFEHEPAPPLQLIKLHSFV